jgi:hypothetical protein
MEKIYLVMLPTIDSVKIHGAFFDEDKAYRYLGESKGFILPVDVEGSPLQSSQEPSHPEMFKGEVVLIEKRDRVSTPEEREEFKNRPVSQPVRSAEEVIRISAGVYLTFQNKHRLSLADCEEITAFVLESIEGLKQ